MERTGTRTTSLGTTPGEEVTPIEGVDEVIGDEWTTKKSWRTFTAALAIGLEDLQENAANFENAEDLDFQLISVLTARRLGILPIAFQSDREFIAAPRK